MIINVVIFQPISWLPSCSAILPCHSCYNDLILPGPFGPAMYSFPNGLTRPWAFLPMGSCVPFFLGHPRPLLLTLYSHGLLLTSLGFPGPLTSYSSLGFMGLPSIPYSLCLHCFGFAATHSYFFHITQCPWICYSLFLYFRALLSSFAFSRPIYLFHGPVIHYSCRLGLIVFLFSISCQLPYVAEFGFLSYIWFFSKKDP